MAKARIKKKINMKQAIADKLVLMLDDHPLDGITIKELTLQLGISRQAFYYHFHDIYEIVEWFFQKESDVILREFSTIDNWQVGYMLMMQWVQNHRRLVMNCFHSVRKDYVENFMNRVLYQYIEPVVLKESQGMQVTERQIAFIARFFTLAINAISLEWIGNGMKEDPHSMAHQVNLLIKGDFKKALRHFEEDNLNKIDTSYEM